MCIIREEPQLCPVVCFFTECHCLWHIVCLHQRARSVSIIVEGKIVTFHCFYRFFFVVIFVGSVIFTPQVSIAYQFSALQERQETITGHIRSIDQATGIITVETATRIVTLEAPPEAITGWKEGDPVVVKIDATEPREHEEVDEKGPTLLWSGPTANSAAPKSQ